MKPTPVPIRAARIIDHQDKPGAIAQKEIKGAAEVAKRLTVVKEPKDWPVQRL